MAAQFGCGRRSLAATAGGGNSRRSRASSVSSSGSGQMRPARRARRMHSPAAVALTPRAAAILRLDMPAADSLSRSRILRMGNLGPGIGALLLWKGAKPMLIRGLPNGARPSRPEESHLEPLTDPDLTLSRHPARAIA